MANRLFASISKVFAAVLALVAIHPLYAGQNESPGPVNGSTWKFSVFLDNKEIGYHNFYLAELGDTKQLKSTASFEYKLMFVRLFHYEHEHSEIWNGDCLQSINSRTDSNGEPFRVDGRQGQGEFRVSTKSGEESLPECIMSFAYWNPSFLEQSTLLNTQDGEFLKVNVSEPVYEELEILGKQVPSYRYSLTASELKLELWYSEEGEWLALESEVSGGRILRYSLTEGTVLQASTSQYSQTVARVATDIAFVGGGN